MTVATAPEAHRAFPLRFRLPREFAPIDLTAEPAERAERLHRQLTESLPQLPAEQRLHVLMANQYLVERMLAEGVLYAATFLGRSDRDTTAATTAQFTVLTRPANDRRGRPLETVMEILRNERPHSEAQLVDLPIGRCLSVMDETWFRTPTNPAGGQAATVHHVRQLQLIHPLLDRGELAFFTLSTECLRDWDDYVAMMAGICRTIEWADTGDHTSIGNILDG